ncbi:MAG: ABC transporter permease [Planctomycetota bacterium]
MRVAHLQAVLWLRWRILGNRVRRGSKLGNVLLALLLVLGVACSLGSFVIALVLGIKQLPKAEPAPLMFVWIGLSVGFLLFWMIGLLTDLQRSDSMSLKNLLHLPVSLAWVFLYNYLSSFVSYSIAIFLPAMVGLALAQVIVFGPRMLVPFALLTGFFVMITALTYQLRGWLARLMENKRRGRNVIAIATIAFVLLVQAPNLLNLSWLHGTREGRDERSARMRELATTAMNRGPDAEAANAEYRRLEEEGRAEDRANELAFDRAATRLALIVPVGWLSYGVRASFEGHDLRSFLCAAGMLGIGVLSLLRSFRKTTRTIVGGDDPGHAAAARHPGAPAGASRAVPGRPALGSPSLVERRLPLVSDRVSAIATATLRSILRAPEIKLLLLSPVILFAVFGVLLSQRSSASGSVSLGPFPSLAAISLSLVSVVQLIQNQFALDRDGFRALVLSPIARSEILLGKNIATAPIALSIGIVALLGVQFFVGTDLAHFTGSLLQLVSAYLLLCVTGNTISILAPVRLREGSLKAVNTNFKTVILQLLSILFIPFTLSPLLLPSLAEFLLRNQLWAHSLPLFPLLHAGVLGLVLLLYRSLLRRLGALLQARESHILEVLTRE